VRPAANELNLRSGPSVVQRFLRTLILELVAIGMKIRLLPPP
jgi:hypothetical protein